MAAASDLRSFANTPAWLLVLYLNMFFGCAGFSIVLPTVWPYLRQLGSTPEFLAWVVAMYSIGEGTGGWLVGQVFARHPDQPKLLLQGGMLLGFLASGLYTVAPIFGPTAAPHVILAARFLSGFDNGGRQTIEQTFIGTHVPVQHQTTISSRLSSFAITGVMLGPAFGAPLQACAFRIPLLQLEIDGNNGPGLVLCAVCAINITSTSLFFRPAALQEQSGAGPAGVRGTLVEKEAPPRRAGLFICYLIFFCVNLSMASLETITPIIAQRLYGWGPCLDPGSCGFHIAQVYVNLLLTTGGFLSLVMTVLMSCYLGAKIFGHEVLAISVGLTVALTTNLGSMDWFGFLPAWRFVSSYLLGAFFGGLMRGPTVALLCQIIGPHEKASYMGLLFAIGAVPRVVGPFVFVAALELPRPLWSVDYPDVYSGPVPRTWLLYGSQALLFFASLLCVALAGESVLPHAALTRSSGLALPFLDKESSPSASEQPWLPMTPTGVREGIQDLAPLLRARSSGSLSSTPEAERL